MPEVTLLEQMVKIMKAARKNDGADELPQLEIYLQTIRPVITQFVNDEDSGACTAGDLEQFAIYLFYHS